MATVLAVSRPRLSASVRRGALVVGCAATVRFVEADLFSWSADRRYDAVFFGFWISHVPEDDFASFWSRVAEALEPGGRVFFFDETIEARSSSSRAPPRQSSSAD